jgi:hypothetical protein
MVFPSFSTTQYFKVSTQSFNYMDKSNSFNLHPWHTLCLRFNRTLLLAQHHARSRSNLNQHSFTRFYDQYMTALTRQQFFPRTRVTKTVCIPLRPTSIIAGLLLIMMYFLTGCGGDGEGQASTPAYSGITASLAWNPVQDPSVHSYIVHYGRQSPGQSGSCEYENSIRVHSPSATVTNLEANTLYYFTVSADNDLESACSNEVSIITDPPPSVQTDPRSPNRAPEVPSNDPSRVPSSR